VKEIRWKSCF